jgi:hypothetical protein
VAGGRRSDRLAARVSGRALAPLLALFLVVGCGGSDGSDEQGAPGTGPGTSSEARTETAAPDRVKLVPMPAAAAETCRSSAVLAPVCPQLVPEAPYEHRPEVYVAELLPAAGGSPEAFNLQWGAENPARPERNRPPHLSHVIIAAGPSKEALGDVETRRLGDADWNGRSGTLLRAAAYPHGGIHGNHLIFLWREDGREYLVSLHTWKPLAETRETLEAIVASLPSRP